MSAKFHGTRHEASSSLDPKEFRYLTNARMVTVDGIRLVCDRARVPAIVRDLMYREVYEDTERQRVRKRLPAPGIQAGRFE